MVRAVVAAVSYLNTVPFIYGIEHADSLRGSLLLSPPSGCASLFYSGRADIALVPVAATFSKPDTQIITPYCLGTNGAVRTVVLVANSPIDKITDIYLDNHSLTSVMLTRVLCAQMWGIDPVWHEMQSYHAVETPRPTDAFLLIGDKVFDYEGRFKYSYDLGECWNKHTGLPFVFAVWVARENVDCQVVAELETALRFGIENIQPAIDFYGHSGKKYAYDYLTKNLNYQFDSPKQAALNLFREKSRMFSPPVNPG